MSQTKLAAFSEDAPKPAPKAYNCWTCLLKIDVTIQGGHQKVHCKGNGLRDFREICSSWTNGHDLAHFPKVPEGVVPRSRA